MDKKKDLKEDPKKMTIEEYSALYSRPESYKKTKTIMYLLTVTVGAVIFAVLFFLVKELFAINEIAGYIGAGVAAILFIILYIIPAIRLNSVKSFMTNVKAANAKEAQRRNKKLREDIADKMIEITAKTDVIGWYSDEAVGKLAVARHTNDGEALKAALNNIYATDVKKAANKIIRDHALKVGIATAVSQSEKLDTAFVCIYELNLIKNIVYLYGYRPSDAQMLKIYRTVLMNSLVAYGLNSATAGISAGIAKKVGEMGKGIPVLGSILGTVIQSASQGVIDASMTVLVGFQTKKYLKKEFGLQDLLDSIDIPEENDEEEQASIIKEVTSSVQFKDKQDKNKESA